MANKYLFDKETMSGKQVPEMEKPMSYEYGDRAEWGKDFDKYEKHLTSLNTIPFVGFSDEWIKLNDGRVLEEGIGFELQHQFFDNFIGEPEWQDCPKKFYEQTGINSRRIIAIPLSSSTGKDEQGEVEKDAFVKKHLEEIWKRMKQVYISIYIKPMFDSLPAASIKYFLETGTVNGAFNDNLCKMMDNVRLYCGDSHSPASLPLHKSGGLRWVKCDGPPPEPSNKYKRLHIMYEDDPDIIAFDDGKWYCLLPNVDSGVQKAKT